ERAQGAPCKQPPSVGTQLHALAFWLRASRCSIPVPCGGDAMRSGLLTLLLVGAAVPGAWAQAPAASPAAEVVALKSARMSEGGSAPRVSKAGVVVEGGKIKAAGSGVAVPAGARVIDLGNATLLPGFIDAHVHLTGESSDDWYRSAVEGLRRTVPEKAIRATEYVRRTRMAGLPTVRHGGGA